MPKKILIIDDEQDIRDSLALFLSEEGYSAIKAESSETALEQLSGEDIDIVLCDIRMPGIDGIELLKRIRDWYPRTSVVIMTAYASVDTAVQAMRNGAHDYILKPLEFDELLIRLRHLVKHREVLFENAILRSRLKDDLAFGNIIGNSREMQKVFELIRKVSMTKSNVLITGKSGTGKELVAKAVHYNSERKDKVFLPLNCGAISETLIESELFGHKRGAFTDAYQDKPGVFRLADGGTLFLDEIAEIPMHLQVKLLRALDERIVMPVGGSAPVSFDVRIISATNQDLPAKVREGLFREDLYYRLNVVEIRLPELSERKEDIPLLIQHFIVKYAEEMRKSIKGVYNETMRVLLNHSWRGGVRELENAIEHAVIFCDEDYISVRDLPIAFSSTKSEIPQYSDELREAVRHFERKHILDVMRRNDFNKEQTAQALQIGLSSLYRKLDELGIKPDDQP